MSNQTFSNVQMPSEIVLGGGGSLSMTSPARASSHIPAAAI